MAEKKVKRHAIDIDRMPEKFPTHDHEAAFWESLGRTVGTFGFLEEVLGKAIFAFTATRPYQEAEVRQAYAEWLPTLERALIDPLGKLIDAYEKAVREHPCATTDNFDDLLDDLRKASSMRNILCHGSWGPPDPSGASLPLFVNRQKLVVDSAMDRQFIDQVQRHAAGLAIAILNTVTHMGWQFPGSAGPGVAILQDPPMTQG